MPGEIHLSIGLLYSFLLVLVRVGGALIFVPLPGMKSSADGARAALAAGFTLALFARWPVVEPTSDPMMIAGWVLAEAAVGIAIGVPVAIVLEIFQLAAQILGLQAGYAYASTIDPNTDADSGVLLVFAQLMGGMLFFALGLDRQILRLFAETLSKVPPGGYRPGPGQAESVIRLGAGLFSVGIRMALPVVALLVMVDVALALLGRLNAQLQLVTLAFPAKMMIALSVLSIVAALFPRIAMQFTEEAWGAIHKALGI